MEGIRDTSTLTLRKILGNGLTYTIPKFQRDYSWETEQWDDLWQDLIDLYEGKESSHYMGYLVLQTSNNKEHLVIDGQQRLTTISILILAVLKRLQELEELGQEPLHNKTRREQLHNSYIGYLDPVTLIAQNKLQLNRHNNDFYKTYIVPLQHLPQRNINPSERLMKGCFAWFYDKIGFLAKDSGKALVAFVDNMVDQLFFTVITVGDELNAYRVFETLNARGVQLSASDLLKNYLFSTVDTDPLGTHTNEFDQLETMWARIVDKLGDKKLPEFLRYYWNSKHKTVRKNNLFKTIKKHITSKQEVFVFLRDIDRFADIYAALLNPNDELWKGKKAIVERLNELHIFGAKQPISLLLSAYNNLSESDFLKVLTYASIIYMRYNVIGGLNPNEQEVVFNNTAQAIAKDKTFKKAMLKPIYPSDKEFAVNFANKELRNYGRNKKVIKYILVTLENSISGTDYDMLSDRNTVEHILPENPDDHWHVDDETITNYRYRLGNLCLLERGKNRDIENQPYKATQAVYAKSEFTTTQAIAEENDSWSAARIERRQQVMARRATSIWSIRF